MNAASRTHAQIELESRAAALAHVDLAACDNLEDVFGGAKDWVMALGPFRFLLVPYLGEWWFYDEAHREWRFTGKKIGQARFIYDGTGLRAQDTASPVPARRFCSACGARVEAHWNFCQSCGGKLST